MPLAEAAAEHPELVARPARARSCPATDAVHRPQRGALARRRARLRPGGHSASTEPLKLTISGAAGEEIEWRDADRPRARAPRPRSGSATRSEGEGLFNGVVELVVGDGANLRYVCEQELSDEGWVFATQRAEVGRDANLDWVALGFGSARGKVRMETKLAGRGSSAKVTGAYAGDGTQHLDYDTTQEHAAEDTTSDLAFRGVLAERGDRGLARDDPGRPGRPAHRRLPGEPQPAALHRRPRRRDPRASRSRPTTSAAPTPPRSPRSTPSSSTTCARTGSSDAEAKRLVIEGFLQELVERAHEGPIRDALRDELEGRLERLLERA